MNQPEKNDAMSHVFVLVRELTLENGKTHGKHHFMDKTRENQKNGIQKIGGLARWFSFSLL